MADKYISQITPLGSSDTYKLKDQKAIENITRSGTTFTATRRDGTTFTFSQQDNNIDEKVKQSNTVTNKYRKILLSYQNDEAGTESTEDTAQVYKTPLLEYLPSQGRLFATGVSNKVMEYTANRGDYQISMGFGSGNKNHGLYSWQKNAPTGDWMIYSDENGNVRVKGSADTLTTGRTFKVNLASTSASTAFDGSADITDIGVTGTLPIAHGGTGAITELGARQNLDVPQEDIVSYFQGDEGKHYIETSLTCGSSNFFIGFRIWAESTYAAKRPSIIVGSGYWNSTSETFTNAAYYDATKSVEGIELVAGTDNKLYIAIEPTTVYQRYRVFVYYGTNRSRNYAERAILTAPTATVTVSMSRVANYSATRIASDGTTAQFWRGDNQWSNELLGGLLKITNNSNTVTIGSANNSYTHFTNSADIPFYFNKSLWVAGNLYPYGTSNTCSLGSSSKRWKSLLIGTADSYGGTAKPIYWKDGVPTELSDTVGATDKPVFLSSGTITASTSTIGSGVIPIYMASGQIKASTSTAGTATKPVWLDGGTIKAGTYELKATVNASENANRAAYYSATTAIEDAGSIYMTASTLGVNQTSITSGQTFEVTGKAHINNTTSNNGTTATPPAFSVGILTGTNIGISPTGIQAKNNTTTSTLYLNYYSGPVIIGQPSTPAATTIHGLLTLNRTDITYTAEDRGTLIPLIQMKYKNTGTGTYTKNILAAIETSEANATVDQASIFLGSSGGSLVLGAGESAATVQKNNNLNQDENIYLIADTGTRFYVNANTAANAKHEVTIDTNGLTIEQNYFRMRPYSATYNQAAADVLGSIFFNHDGQNYPADTFITGNAIRAAKFIVKHDHLVGVAPTAAKTVEGIKWTDNNNVLMSRIYSYKWKNNATHHGLYFNMQSAESTSTADLFSLHADDSLSDIYYVSISKRINTSLNISATAGYTADGTNGAGSTLYNNGILYLNSTAGNWAYIRLNNSSNLWDIATNSSNNTSSLQFRNNSSGSNATYVRFDLNGSIYTGNLTIGGKVDTDSGKTIVSSSTLYLKTSASASIIFNTNNTNRARFDIDGHFKPESTNTYTLGISGTRWKSLFIGTADSYGGTTQPIWWNAGVPTAITTAIATAYGGTGNNTFTQNRLIWASEDTKLSSATNLWTNGTTIRFLKEGSSSYALLQNTYNSTVYDTLLDYQNGNIVLNAASLGLYLGYNNTTYIDFLRSLGRWTDTGLGVGTTSPSYKLDVRGTGYFTNTVHINKDNGSGTVDVNTAPLLVGTLTKANLAIGNNAIQARSNGAKSTLYFNYDSGNIQFGSSTSKTAPTKIFGTVTPGANATYDLGTTDALRWKSGFFTTSLRVGAIDTDTGTTATTRSVYIGPDGFYANSVDVTSSTQSSFVLRGKGKDYAKLYVEILGVVDTPGRATLTLGNSQASTAADSSYGKLILYSYTTKYSSIESSADIKGHQLNYLPIYNATGTSSYYGRLVGIYKGTSGGSTSGFSDVGSTSQPVYVTANGVVKAISLKPTLNNLLSSLTEGTADALVDAGYIISSNNNGATDDWYLRSNVTIWNYIKGKYSSTDTTLNTGPIHIRSTSGGDNALIFDRASGEYQYIQSKNPDNSISIVFAASNSDANTTYRFTKDAFYPKANNKKNLGLSGNKWANVYATNFNGALKGNADTATAANITSTDNAIVRFNGTAGAFQNSKAFINDSGSITAGTFTANTATSAEIDVKAASGAGTIYLYSAKTITGNRGIWLQNAGGESSGSKGLLVVNQDNNITTHASMATNLTVATSNTYNLGASGARWKAAFIGTDDSYGSATNPIYWSNGVPVATNTFLTTELVHYCDKAATTLYYVTTSITVTTSSNCWIYGTITGTKGNTSSAGMDVRFQVYWNKSTFSAAYYQDSTNAISEMNFYTDSSNKVYFSFACTQYSRARITVLINSAVGNANYATAISITAPATFSITKAATKIASTSAVKTALMPNNSTAHYILGVTGTTADSNASLIKAYRTSTAQVYFRGDTGILMGAAWNDYAEYRQAKNNVEIEPGRVVKEVGDETLELTTERLQRGCSIVSNTFGISIGESETNKLPLAVAGRVLAYPYEDREEFKNHIGWPVCSGPNGTVSIMTEEEEMKYPSRIIGIISAIPDYEIWHGGADVIVDERIWIKVR